MGENVQEWWTKNSEVLRSTEEILRLISEKGPPPDKKFWSAKNYREYLRRKKREKTMKDIKVEIG